MGEYKSKYIVERIKTMSRIKVSDISKFGSLLYHNFFSDEDLINLSDLTLLDESKVREHMYIGFKGIVVNFNSFSERNAFVKREIDYMSTIPDLAKRREKLEAIEANIICYGVQFTKEFFNLTPSVYYFICSGKLYSLNYKTHSSINDIVKFVNEELILFLAGLEPCKVFVSGQFEFVKTVDYDSAIQLFEDELELFRRSKTSLRHWVKQRLMVEVETKPNASARDVKIQRALDILETALKDN
jgi:hypothetical protein